MDLQPAHQGSNRRCFAPLPQQNVSKDNARKDDSRVVETDIPSRLDALHWSGFHTRVVLALGITWILDGLEVTLAGALSGALKESPRCILPISMSGLPTAPISPAR